MSPSRSPNSDEDAGPSKKKIKVEEASTEPPTSKQSNLHQFFASSKLSSPKSSQPNNGGDRSKENKGNDNSTTADADAKHDSEALDKKSLNNNPKENNEESIPDPIIPKEVTSQSNARWKVVENCMLVRTIPKEEPRSKAAAFDVDGTIFNWRIPGWPSRFEHYELWSANVITKLQKLHDKEGYKLVLISNQGAIRGAFNGKKATFVKSLFEWLAKTVDRPIHAVMSTNKKLGYHKPNPGMWEIVEKECNQGKRFDIDHSFFVGDSIEVEDDPQGGVDSKFAKSVGALRDTTLTFYTPEEYFGPSDTDKRKKQGAMADYDAPPKQALAARAALLGGYLQGPVVLILSGVQGSGKSTFCRQLFVQSNNDNTSGLESENHPNDDDHPWVHLSQDTINNGKPGKRELVEEKTREAIRQGRSVVMDRMHLDAEQRKHFVDIAKELNAPVHVLVFQTPKEVIAKRVRERSNHPGGVEGEKGVKIAMSSLSKMVLPNYKEEGFDLITCVHEEEGVKKLGIMYRQVQHPEKTMPAQTAVLSRTAQLSSGISMPMMALGTMKMGKRMTTTAVSTALKAGMKAIDTAPTYNNEEEVGQALPRSNDAFVIVKVPKRASEPEKVFQELNDSLRKLKRNKADLLILHWPCDVMEGGTLKSVWEAMEKCVTDNRVCSLGVSNFNVDALRQLLPHCTIPPAVNQVERHPLLPQMELLDFCANQNILVQAHTPLGQGTLLSHEAVTNIAKQEKLTNAQVLLKWNLQQGVAVVPKCSTEEHQKEAVAAISPETSALTPQQMKALDEIKIKNRFVAPPFMVAPGKVYSWKN